MSRDVLLWQIADLLRLVRFLRQWWAVQEPETYGVWAEDQR